MSVLGSESLEPDEPAVEPEPATLAAIMCGEALELPCPTCLAVGRAMAPLREPARAYCMLLAGLRQEDVEELVTYALVCWECGSFMERMLRFQEQVLHANMLMRSYVTDEPERQNKTFSALSSIVKVGFDQLLLHEEYIPKSSLWDVPLLPNSESAAAEEARQAVEAEARQAGSGAEWDAAEEGEGTRRRRRRAAAAPTRKSERKYRPVKREATAEMELEAPALEKQSRREPRETKRKTIVKTIGSWPGKKVLLKGRKKNVKIVSMSMPEADMLRFRAEDRASATFANFPFKCDSCIKGFSFVNLLERHNSTHHSESAGEHRCDICSVYVASAEQLQRHRKKHYNLYVCSACGYSHRLLPDVFRHYTSVHESGKTYPCNHCDEVFPSSRKMRYHREITHKEVYKCEHCAKVMRNQQSLCRMCHGVFSPGRSSRKMRYHREITHKEVYKCEHCAKVMRNQQSFKAHLLIHTGMPTLECSICRRGCRGETGLYAHMRSAHAQLAAEEAYCADCGIQFKSKAIYRSHLRTSVKHATPAQLKYNCDQCEKKFLSETALKQHHRYYHLEYKCSVCSKRLNNWYSLDKHVKFVHEGREMPRKHVCESCGKAFKTRRALDSHQLTHTGERPFSCAVCGATFAQKSTLATHRRLVHYKLKRPPAATVEPLPV